MEKTEQKLLTIAGVILAIFILFILAGCKKNDPQPEPISHIAIQDITTHTLSLKYDGTSVKLSINGVEQNNLNETFTLKQGDKIELIDNGRDRTRLGTNGEVLGKQEGYVSIQIIIDNKIVYEVNCNCDAYYTQTI